MNVQPIDDNIKKEEYIRTYRVGDQYRGGRENRETVVRVDGVDFEITENLWKDTEDKFDTEKKWSVTARLEVSQECATKEECMTSAQDNIRILKALGVLGYELSGMEDDGVSIWDRPADDRE